MFVITLKDNPQGIYSVFDAKEQRIVPIFIEEDDADEGRGKPHTTRAAL